MRSARSATCSLIGCFVSSCTWLVRIRSSDVFLHSANSFFFSGNSVNFSCNNGGTERSESERWMKFVFQRRPDLRRRGDSSGQATQRYPRSQKDRSNRKGTFNRSTRSLNAAWSVGSGCVARIASVSSSQNCRSSSSSRNNFSRS